MNGNRGGIDPGGSRSAGCAPSFAPEPIAGDLLVLHPLRPEHAEGMAQVLADPELYGFIGGEPPSPQALRVRYGRLAAGSPDSRVVWCNWMVELRDEGRLVGTVQATVGPCEESAGGRTAELSWVVGTPWQGRGIATEAAGALVRWLRERAVREVVAHVHPGHKASAAVAAAAGLKDSGLRSEGEAKWRLSPVR